MQNKFVASIRRALGALARRAPFSRDVFARLEQSEKARHEATTQLESLRTAQRETPPAPPAGNALPIPKFWERNYWEPTVQFPIRDYCRAGDVVFDIGANAGGLSMLMSRLVGPRGVVCAFEASPRIIEMTVNNLVSAGCSNVQVYHRAIYHTSHESVAIYAGSHLNDSLYPAERPKDGNFQTVATLALDDFVESTGLVPKLIKIDIEGAEFDALQGMKRLLASAKPILILEQSPADMRCHAFLTERGYAAVDLANYRRVRSPADFGSGVSVANILFVHGSASDDPYLDEKPPETVAQIPPSLFRRSSDGSLEIARAVPLPAGRYLCRAEFSASGTNNEIFAGIDIDGEVALRYHTYTRFMADSYRDWVFALQKDSQVAPYLRFVKGRDETLDWRGVEILRFPQFARLPRPVVD
jgi:FkbM family methyltransferase